ncbi:hypothetical protein [Burkholderia glumae]|uniref:hypothetical protein n=1 Tax=Burkholderia glumae TaxID=337 RepID=UPI00214FA12C|nr:hypothetical protein [Burkholderia glumae]
MKDTLLTLKTNQDLLAGLSEAAGKKQSQADLAEQRVSFVYGLMKSDSGVTRDQVRNIIAGGTIIGSAS